MNSTARVLRAILVKRVAAIKHARHASQNVSKEKAQMGSYLGPGLGCK